MDQLKPLTLTLKQLKQLREDEWAPPPKSRVVVSTELVKKTCEDVDENEFQIEIPHSASLAEIKPKSVKCKITDKDNKELVGHYWDA